METRINVINTITKFVGKIETNESLAGLLRKQMKNRIRSEKLPKNYFYLKQLCDPMHTYWSYVSPEIEKSPELARLLNWGKKLHKLSSFWFGNLENFRVCEGKIDGIFVGIPGVRGSIDYMIGESIIELKTKRGKMPENEEEIFSLYPQDIEQLAFYAVIHPENPKIDYLIFLTDSQPYKIKIFKIAIKDLGKIKSLLISRIDKLNEALEKKDPSKLGQCRYYKKRCEFHEKSICSCEELEPQKTDLIRKAIEITIDQEFTNKMQGIIEAKNLPFDIFTTYNVIAPRKYLEKRAGLGKIGDDDEDSEIRAKQNKKAEYRACMESLIRELRINLDISFKEEVKKLSIEPRVLIPYRWTKLKTSKSSEEEIVPYSVRVSLSGEKRSLSKPDTYSLAELGIICSSYKKSRGLIFMVYPNFDDFIQVFEVSFNKIEEISKEIKSILDNLEKEDTNIGSLPPCPGYVGYDGKCTLMKNCHSEGCIGCRPGYVPKKG